ncbi:MAG: 30S ribosome-binding factor RbfA [Christensenellaceae bacterium]|jgi:ribosome-binding factor A|nr:30S ribosome-binding factor RbfA [Christensenellaceae bacterium]
MSLRLDRLNSQLKKDIASIITYEIGDPRLGLVSVTSVKITPDLKFAKVFVSIFGKEKDESMKILKSAAGFIRNKLAHSMKIKTVPELTFVLDEGMEHAEKINKIIESFEGGNKDAQKD